MTINSSWKIDVPKSNRWWRGFSGTPCFAFLHAFAALREHSPSGRGTHAKPQSFSEGPAVTRFVLLPPNPVFGLLPCSAEAISEHPLKGRDSRAARDDARMRQPIGRGRQAESNSRHTPKFSQIPLIFVQFGSADGVRRRQRLPRFRSRTLPLLSGRDLNPKEGRGG